MSAPATKSSIPDLRLYAKIRVRRDNSAVLDIYAKFQPVEGATLGGSSPLTDNYTKTMISYVTKKDGLPATLSALDLGDNPQKAFDDFRNSKPDRIYTEETGNAWDVAAKEIWSVVSDKERRQLADHFFTEAASKIYLGPVDSFNDMGEISRAQRKFIREFEKARTEGRLAFSLHGEYAGLLVEPQK